MSPLQTVSEPSHSANQKWHLNDRRVTSWRVWDGEMVVYDDLSGDTLKLDVVMVEVFKRLQQGDATLSELTEHLAHFLDLDNNRRLEHVAETAVNRLVGSGLAEPQAAAGSGAAPNMQPD